MIPFIFSSLAIKAVVEAAMAMVEEVRRQFRTIPGIMEGTGKPEYDKCVAISTEASLKKMMLPGAIALLTPIIIGFVFGPEVLGGFLAGATVCGVLMGIFQNNAGGAWDNAKKSFEKGVEINGEMYYKKSEPHKASVTGDTVGDPFKDTSGPSMNILIKLMSIVSLVIAPTLAKIHHDKIEKRRNETIQSLMKMATNLNVPKDENTTTANLLADANATAGAATNATPATATAAAVGAMNADGDFVADLGANTDIKLANGTTITVGANSVEAKLNAFLNDKAKAVSKADWFSLDRLYFESGKSTLKPTSEAQLKNIAALLAANPTVELKLGGYTDNSGDSLGNVKISMARAETAKAALVKLGVVANRLVAEGYGPQHPICAANDTKACMAQNRRIDVNVTKK
jgi:K(+)-stimulated pyrophosphate-energized sodium pump